MHEELDYSLLGRTPALPDFCSNRGTTSPTHTETLWPSGRRQYTIGLNGSINMMFRAPEDGDLWGVDATAETTKGTFHIQYDWSGQLHRVRVSLADMIIFGSMHANFAEKERQSAISRRNQYDAYVSVFPKDHVIRVQQYGVSREIGIEQFDDGVYSSMLSFPEFPNINLSTSYDAFFTIQPYFLHEMKSIVTYISMHVHLPESLYGANNTDALHGLGSSIMGTPPPPYGTLTV